MLGRLLRRRGTPSAHVPRETRVYAIGDIHGRAELLDDLLGQITTDARDAPPRRVIVFIGDYIDRGLQSRQVLERLSHDPMPGFECVFLKGNHDAWLLDFLNGDEEGPAWFANGGRATLYSYGIGSFEAEAGAEGNAWLSERLRAAMPAAHLDFLRGLALWHLEGDYLFVHAGVRPGVPLAEQSERDLLWIRNDFLASKADHGKIVVHGHTLYEQPVVTQNRIAIDTGAYATGHLTALVLEDGQRRFLRT